MEFQNFNLSLRISGVLPLLLFFILVAAASLSFPKVRKKRKWPELKGDPFCQLVVTLALCIALLLLNLGYSLVQKSVMVTEEQAFFQVLLMVPILSLPFFILLERRGLDEKFYLLYWRMLPVLVSEALLISVMYWCGLDLNILKPCGYVLVLSVNLYLLASGVKVRSWKDFASYSSNTYPILVQMCYLVYMSVNAVTLMSTFPAVAIILSAVIAAIVTSFSYWWLSSGERKFISFKMYGTSSAYRQDIRVLAEDSIEYGAVDIKLKLFKMFDEEKPYLSPDLTIRDMATKLCTNQSYLSRFLNHSMKMNFNEFVNNYRVNEAMALFEEDNGISLPELCRRSGFRNVSSFNNAFRRYTGSTPGEWCRKVKRMDDYEKAKDNK